MTTNQEKPKVDILMATYNGERYIEEQIESLQKQSYSNWSLLVSDDGSSDNTIEAVARIAQNDHRIKIVSANSGFHSSTGNFLFLLKHSSAPYAMFCDQDDIWLPNKIEESINAMRKAEKASGEQTPIAIFADSKIVNKNLETICESFTSTLNFDPKTVSIAQLMVSNVAQGATLLLNRSLSALVNSTEIPPSFEHHDHWVAAIAKATGTLVYIDNQLLLYRQHSDNAVGADTKESPKERLKSITGRVFRDSWIRKWGEAEGLFSTRASELLSRQLPFNPESKQALSALQPHSLDKRVARIEVARQYKLLRNTGIYGKACQLLGLIIPSRIEGIKHQGNR